MHPCWVKCNTFFIKKTSPTFEWWCILNLGSEPFYVQLKLSCMQYSAKKAQLHQHLVTLFCWIVSSSMPASGERLLNWFASYLEGRTFSVEIDNITSSSAACTSGVPQGSVLGPLLFSIYLLPLPNIFHKHLTSYHCYADDIHSFIYLLSLMRIHPSSHYLTVWVKLKLGWRTTSFN